MGADRNLDWDGLFNARDLGGLRAHGGQTRWRAVIRSESVERLTAAGWSALWDYGVRTVVDLRNPDERGTDAAPRPAGLCTVRVPLEDYDGDREFWRPWRESGLWSTPLYYRAFLDRFPGRAAAAVTAIARAVPGGVLVHCAAGRDRTGLVTLLLLALAGVSGADIAADHAQSDERLVPLGRLLGLDDPRPALAEAIAAAGTTATDALLATVAGLDPAGYLSSAGMGADDVAAVRARLRSADGGREDAEVVA
ncbi:tyrosine-protein phosphatase [Actinophytocola sp.]|uniref:tyrosine-protein phosphatase n=1 Tax=Actinophytocola sp. TaxID=1872138 RepID=UPI002D7FD9D3|nr:tyrosine-protein phosphatase [Actinophytocola sp.]HET9139885.1 tyrosine-protein phosphatase [Actinophytocola sp.]